MKQRCISWVQSKPPLLTFEASYGNFSKFIVTRHEIDLWSMSYFCRDVSRQDDEASLMHLYTHLVLVFSHDVITQKKRNERIYCPSQFRYWMEMYVVTSYIDEPLSNFTATSVMMSHA